MDAMLAMSSIRCQDEYVVALGAYDLHFPYELCFSLCWHLNLQTQLTHWKYHLDCFEILHQHNVTLRVPCRPQGQLISRESSVSIAFWCVHGGIHKSRGGTKELMTSYGKLTTSTPSRSIFGGLKAAQIWR